MSHQAITQHVADYYSKKLEAHGVTHLGVDWNSAESQWLRFRQLHRGFHWEQPFSIADYGCGYGALLNYLLDCNLNFQYTGYDISEAMIQAARNIHSNQGEIRFIPGDQLETADYVVASGIFNVRMEYSNREWEEYIAHSLQRMDKASDKGFSFNILSSYSDPSFRRKDLYYADPCYWFDWCKRQFSPNVSLFHDYNLYEFTLSLLKPNS
jgi:SAM-dependent methyltransferase